MITTFKMKIKLNRYNPPKPFFKMSIKELVKYNKKCVYLDNLYFKKKQTEKRKKTRNKRMRKTRKNRWRKTRKRKR